MLSTAFEKSSSNKKSIKYDYLTCKHCGIGTFKNKQELHQHYQKVHILQSIIKDPISGYEYKQVKRIDGVFTCELCQKTWIYANRAVEHVICYKEQMIINNDNEMIIDSADEDDELFNNNESTKQNLKKIDKNQNIKDNKEEEVKSNDEEEIFNEEKEEEEKKMKKKMMMMK